MPSPDLPTRGAHLFLLMEAFSRLAEWSDWFFWHKLSSPVREPAAHLPALAAAVREKCAECDDTDLWKYTHLWKLAHHPLPHVLPSEAISWYDTLVAVWEVHRASGDPYRQKPALSALARLDGCGMPDGMQRPSRLPEWLAEARKIVGAGSEPARTEPARIGKWRMEKLEALAALAAWQPAPGVVTSPGTLREWIAFWQGVRQSRSPLLKGIAARALLNLPEANLRAASLHPYGRVPNPPLLLHELAGAIRVAAQKTARSKYDNYLSLLDWEPAAGMALPVAGLTEVALAWLKLTSHDYWRCREGSWRQLIHWEQTGSLTACRINLLPFLVNAVATEKDTAVLWEMARWTLRAEAPPKALATSDFTLLRQLETHWQRHRPSHLVWARASAWLAGIRLHEAGLASEPPETFLEAYLSSVAKDELDMEPLLVLAQWVPSTETPVEVQQEWQTAWRHRSEGKEESIRNVATFALSRRVLEQKTWDAMRRVNLQVWRAGTKEASEVTGSIASRFYEVRAALVRGSIPDLERASFPPTERPCPRLALPPGHIADREWRIENGELKMEN